MSRHHRNGQGAQFDYAAQRPNPMPHHVPHPADVRYGNGVNIQRLNVPILMAAGAIAAAIWFTVPTVFEAGKLWYDYQSRLGTIEKKLERLEQSNAAEFAEIKASLREIARTSQWARAEISRK